MAKVKSLFSLSDVASRQLTSIVEDSSMRTSKSAVIERLIDQEYRLIAERKSKED